MNTTYLGLGSNIYPRLYYIYSALNAIEKNIGTIVSISNIHKTTPWRMPEDTAFFYNLCIGVKTELSPFEVLSQILMIERSLGRLQKSCAIKNYQSRTIDIDILLFNNIIVQEKNLVIPHPYLHERDFVLLPLSEIAGDIEHPVYKKRIKDILS